MPPPIELVELALFVPADRPERFAKAFASGADAAILDLEDAVAASAKEAARTALLAARSQLAESRCPVVVRINPRGHAAHAADIEAVGHLAVAAIMVPKVEDAATVTTIAAASGRPVLALIESARGLADARAIAAAGARLVFGSYDFAADLGCAHGREALLLARAELVLASRLAGQPAPIDGVTLATRDVDLIRDDARYAAALGFGGKLLIHPAQVGPAREGFRPTAEEVAWAERVLAAGAEGGAAVLDGTMIDAPVRLRAEQVRRRAAQ